MARKAPAFQFYVDDFIGGTHYLSASSVGVYVRLLCFQFAYGLLPSCKQRLAKIAGVNDDEFAECWDELRDKFVSDGNGHLLNKRLKVIVDEQVARSEARSIAGKEGGKSKAKRKQRQKQNGNKNKAKGDGVGEGVGEGFRRGEETYSAAFLDFWSAFPSGRKKSKGAAWQAWQKATKHVDASTILAKAAEYAKSDEGRGLYVKMPSTWLNQRCWEDEPEAWAVKDGNSEKPEPREEELHGL
jgi:uncharacterized protein YdaU (DUF1376 family)